MRVSTVREGHIATVTLSRPEKRNAFDAELTASLDTALNELDDDPHVRIILLAADGPAFSAGTDLATGAGQPTGRGGSYGVIERDRRTPLVAVVEGPAVGGGLEVVLACDLVIASRLASFGLPEVQRGLVATCGGLFRGPRALPPMIAAELVLTGDPLPAARAYELGLVNRVCEPNETRSEAAAVAARVAAASPTAVSASLTALRGATGAMDQLGWSLTAAAARTVAEGPDSAEGIDAFLARRTPRWHA